MLSDIEKEELKSMARSAKICEEFRELRKASQLGTADRINIDQLLSFLTAMTRLGPVSVRPKTFVPYTTVRI